MIKSKSKNIYIIGHKNPDTDSVASAIAYIALLDRKGEKATPLVSGEINKGTELALKTFKVKCPKSVESVNLTDSQIILVDHNEEGQWPKGVKKEQIIEVIDHHRVGEDFSTDKAIYIRVEPVGATSTIISKMYREKEIRPEIHTAGLLLSAILTDTLMLRSPSTTDDDRKVVKWLESFVKIDQKKHFMEIFAAKSDLSGLTIRGIIKKDFKEYRFNHSVKMGISMFETLNPEKLLVKKEKIKEGLLEFKKNQNLDYMIFVIVDIEKMIGYVISSGTSEEKAIKKIFKKAKCDGITRLPGIVSRKTLLVPVLEEYFKK